MMHAVGRSLRRRFMSSLRLAIGSDVARHPQIPLGLTEPTVILQVLRTIARRCTHHSADSALAAQTACSPRHATVSPGLVQRIVEPVRNFKLLDIASASADPLERLALVAAFSAAGLCDTERRTRKPFISCVGETYELETQDFALVGEQVESDIGVVQVDGNNAEWSLFCTSSVKSCFHGTNITVDPTS